MFAGENKRRNDRILFLFCLEKAKRNFIIREVIKKKKLSNGLPSKILKIICFRFEIDVFSPQAKKVESEDEDSKESFFSIDSENPNYIVHLNDSTFDEFIAENQQKPILAMFYAPCKSKQNAFMFLFTLSIDFQGVDIVRT